MRYAAIIGLSAMLLAPSAKAQQKPEPFVPIVIDEAAWVQLGAEIDKISMPPPVFRALAEILGRLELSAQAKQKAKQQEPQK